MEYQNITKVPKNKKKQKQLQMRIIKKYIKKDIYLEKEDKELLII